MLRSLTLASGGASHSLKDLASNPTASKMHCLGVRRISHFKSYCKPLVRIQKIIDDLKQEVAVRKGTAMVLGVGGGVVISVNAFIEQHPFTLLFYLIGGGLECLAVKELFCRVGAQQDLFEKRMDLKSHEYAQRERMKSCKEQIEEIKKEFLRFSPTSILYDIMKEEPIWAGFEKGYRKNVSLVYAVSKPVMPDWMDRVTDHMAENGFIVIWHQVDAEGLSKYNMQIIKK